LSLKVEIATSAHNGCRGTQNFDVVVLRLHKHALCGSLNTNSDQHAQHARVYATYASINTRVIYAIKGANKMRNRPILYDVYPALRHGAYSGLTLLPGESETEFRELLEQIIAEYKLVGPSERAIGLQLTQISWREQRLEIYGYAEQARERYSEIRQEQVPQSGPSYAEIKSGAEPDPYDVDKDEKAAEKQARKELGSAFLLIELGEVLTQSRLAWEVELADRLSRRKDRLLKQLLFIRGVKSTSASLPETMSPPLIANDHEAATKVE
jgi:hypothetical protein